MAFETRELSDYAGKPVMLYEFMRGAMVWRYCTADRDVTFGGSAWLAIAISDGGVEQSGETGSTTFDVRLPAQNPVVDLFRAAAPSERVWLRVRRHHWQDDEAPLVWVGTVVQASRDDEAAATLKCQSIIAQFFGGGLRLSWQKTCPHLLYDSQCRVDKSAYAVPMVVDALGGTTVQVADDGGKPDGWFTNGFLEWTVSPGTVERRAIEAHTGRQFGILGTTDGMTLGMDVVAYPGCARTIAECDAKFSNTANYGGVPHLPGKSPFDGTAVF